MTEFQNNAPNIAEDSVDSEIEDYQNSIAEAIASLSEVPDTPEGVSPSSSIYYSNEINFASGEWLNQLAEIQGWLDLDLNLDLPREEVLRSLVSGLDLTPDQGVSRNGELPTLSVSAWEALSSRLEEACRFQADFSEKLETGTPLRDASKQWKEMWAEYADESAEPVSMEPIIARTHAWPISGFIDRNRLNLTPSYQRGDVWGSSDRSALIESVLRGIPLPSIILLQKDGGNYEVVDGKQRLTTLLRFVGKHPLALERVKKFASGKEDEREILDSFRIDYPRFKKYWKNYNNEVLTSKLEDAYYFPFKLRGGAKSTLTSNVLKKLQGKYYSQIRDETITISDYRQPVNELFELPGDYQIPVIIYTKAKRRQIHEVFKIYNKQGVHLNAEEIRNAVYHDVELTRAILVASGDVDDKERIDEVAPSLVGLPGIEQTGKDLASYNFGKARYRRSKVLGWIISTLVHDTGKPLASTSNHTNSMLEKIQTERSLLSKPKVIRDLFSWISRSVHIHSSMDYLWSDEFKDGESGSRWYELQLVASMVGIAMAVMARPHDIEELLDSHADEIFEKSQSPEWQRPEKTQTKEQWNYIARISKDILSILEISQEEASKKVKEKFGTSGFDRLQTMRK